MNKIINKSIKALFALLFMATTLVVKAQIRYLETPVLYEDKHSTSFKVFQSFSEGALASEISNKQYGWYNGNTVLLLGEMYYDGQIIKMKAPMQVGIYRYETKKGDIKTVPVVKQIMTENVIDTTKEQKDKGRKARRRARKASMDENE